MSLLLCFFRMTAKARLILEDRTEFIGKYFTEAKEVFGEVVFNTAMSGYQEVVTDPSYKNQCVIMTYPMIGNYGINDQDNESKQVFLTSVLCKEYCDIPSNWQSVKTLRQYLEEYGAVGVERLDTRSMTLHVRDHGAQRMIITTDFDSGIDSLVAKIKQQPEMVGSNLAKVVTTDARYSWQSNNADSNSKFRIAVLDCGVKYNILRHLESRGCECVVLPIDEAAAAFETSQFDGLFISNGPGDPEPVQAAIQLIQQQLGKMPIFGICLGHQLIAHALGGKTYKLKFGHHGINHPVKNLQTGRVEITSQNHGFCVDVDSLGPDVEVTHVNLYDGTNEGFKHQKYPLFSVQYHPESAPGPCDSSYLFDEFVQMMQEAPCHA